LQIALHNIFMDTIRPGGKTDGRGSITSHNIYMKGLENWSGVAIISFVHRISLVQIWPQDYKTFELESEHEILFSTNEEYCNKCNVIFYWLSSKTHAKAQKVYNLGAIFYPIDTRYIAIEVRTNCMNNLTSTSFMTHILW